MFANPHNDSIPIIMSVFDYRVTVFYRFQAKNDPLFPCTYVRCDTDISRIPPRPRRHTRPSDITCICRNLRLMKNNIQMCHFTNHSCRIFKPYLPTRYISSICGLSRYRTSSPFRRILSFPDVVRPITADGIPSSAIFCTSPSPSAAAISNDPVESI